MQIPFPLVHAVVTSRSLPGLVRTPPTWLLPQTSRHHGITASPQSARVWCVQTFQAFVFECIPYADTHRRCIAHGQVDGGLLSKSHAWWITSRMVQCFTQFWLNGTLLMIDTASWRRTRSIFEYNDLCFQSIVIHSMTLN
jgi:hypothetical protein